MQNRLLALMGEKQARENRPITSTEVARAVGMSRQAIHKWIHNDIGAYPSDTLDRLCEYFDCEVGDILYRVKDNIAS
ncbi:MAG TPA: helix-turn-helix transcriptional regulator [Phototrophicaceae bacterium]|nr:helix-turn-helix transcriptional regulator [Phototrophicaceae bacterium]